MSDIMFGKIFKYELGSKAKDKITEFEGIITARCEYLTGCNQYCITPQAERGDYKDSVYIDEDRIELIEIKKIKKEDVTGDVKGGPEKRVRL